MSSVLRALRKLEQETYTVSGMPGRSSLKTGPMRYSINPIWHYRILAALFFLLLILAVLLAILAGRAWFSAPGSSTPAAVATTTVDAGTAEKVSEALDARSDFEAVSVRDKKMTEFDGGAIPAPASTGESSSAAAVANPDFVFSINDPVNVLEDGEDGFSQTEDPKAPASEDAEILVDAADSQTTWRVINKDTGLPGEIGTEQKAVFQESPATAAAPAIPEFPELDPSAGLSLQAISWSPEPARRLAVINGSLCREGETVDGFVLVRIDPEEVLLSDGRVSARLVFKIR